jgi:hypothetical protein
MGYGCQFLPSMASRDWPPQACGRLDRMDRVEHGWIGIDAGKDHHAVRSTATGSDCCRVESSTTSPISLHSSTPFRTASLAR